MLDEYKKPTKIGLVIGTIAIIIGKAIAPEADEIGGIISLAGGIAFVWGCVSLIKGKGHSGWWGALGIFFLAGLIALLLFPDKHKSNPSE